MIEIIDPKLVTSEISADKRYGKFVWEPLERGYGITLGNSLPGRGGSQRRKD